MITDMNSLLSDFAKIVNKGKIKLMFFYNLVTFFKKRY